MRGNYPRGQLWGGYDPSLFSLDPQKLSEGKPSTAPTAPPTNVAVTQTASKSQVKLLLPEGFGDPNWKRTGEFQRFTAKNLYEKIDGRAEQYLKYDVVELQTTTYSKVSQDAVFIDVFIYKMDKPENAFGIYSVERAADAEEIQLGEQGYKSGASYFFIKGKYYVQIVAGGMGRDYEQAGLKLARAVERGLKVEGSEGGCKRFLSLRMGLSPARLSISRRMRLAWTS